VQLLEDYRSSHSTSSTVIKRIRTTPGDGRRIVFCAGGHTDDSYLAVRPRRDAVRHAIPSTVGDTLFGRTHRSLEALDPATRARWRR